MILTGAKLEEIGRATWGENWPSILAKRLHKARRTIFRWRDSSPPPEVRDQLLVMVEDQLLTLAAHVDELRANRDAF